MTYTLFLYLLAVHLQTDTLLNTLFLYPLTVHLQTDTLLNLTGTGSKSGSHLFIGNTFLS